MEVVKALCYQCEIERPLDKFLLDSDGEIGGLCVYCFQKSVGRKRKYTKVKKNKDGRIRKTCNFKKFRKHRLKIRKLLNRELTKNKIQEIIKNEKLNLNQQVLFLRKYKEKIKRCPICNGSKNDVVSDGKKTRSFTAHIENNMIYVECFGCNRKRIKETA